MFSIIINMPLTAGQKKLPEGLQKAILAKQAKDAKKPKPQEKPKKKSYKK